MDQIIRLDLTVVRVAVHTPAIPSQSRTQVALHKLGKVFAHFRMGRPLIPTHAPATPAEDSSEVIMHGQVRSGQIITIMAIHPLMVAALRAAKPNDQISLLGHFASPRPGAFFFPVAIPSTRQRMPSTKTA